MRQTGNRVYAPFSWGDISTLTRVVGDNDVMGDMVANSTYINKFSKIKPVEYNSPMALTEAQMKSTNWGFGVSGIPSYANWSALRNALSGGITPGGHWTYVKPATWYRTHDFDGYVPTWERNTSWGVFGITGTYLNALYFPFGGTLNLKPNRTSVSRYDTFNLSMYRGSQDGNDDGLLYLSDFAEMGTGYYNYLNWYFGVLLVKQDWSAAYICSCLQTIAQYGDDEDPGLSNIRIGLGGNIEDLPADDYYMLPCVTERCASEIRAFVSITDWASSSAGPGRLVLLDGWRLPISIVASTYAFTISSSYSNGAITFTFENTTGVDIIFANNLFMYLEAQAVFDSDNHEYVENAMNEWGTPGGTTNAGVKYANGVRNGYGTVVAATIDLLSAFTTAHESATLASGDSATFTVQVGTADASGNPYNDEAVTNICYFANMGGGYKYFIY